MGECKDQGRVGRNNLRRAPDLPPPSRARRLEVHPESPIPAASEREHRDSSDNDARRARAGDATRAARPFRLTRSRRHRHDRLHRHRRFDADAFPARRRRLGRGDSAPQHRDRGGHRGARRHRRGDARRRLDALRSPALARPSRAHARSRARSTASSPAPLRRSESGSDSTQATRSRTPITSSAPPCTTPHASPVTPSAGKYSSPASSAKLVADGPNVTFLDGREVELKGLAGQHRLYAVAHS